MRRTIGKARRRDKAETNGEKCRVATMPEATVEPSKANRLNLFNLDIAGRPVVKEIRVFVRP